MSPRWRFKSVRARQVFWFLVVALVPLFTVVTILYHQRSAVIESREFEKLQTIRDLKVRELNGWLNERMGDLQVAAGDIEIRGLEGLLVKDKGEWAREEMHAIASAREHLQRYVDSYDTYNEIFLISAQSGEIVVSNKMIREEWRRKGDAPYFTEVMLTRQPYIKDIYHSKTLGKRAMTFSAPVYGLEHKGEHLIGVLVARIDLENALYPMLQEHAGFGETGETLIVNKDAMALNELRWRENAPLKLKMSAQPVVRAANGETGITETPDYRGEMVLAAYTHIPLTGWGFVVKRDLEEIYASIRAMVSDMAIILVVSAFAVLFVAILLGRIVARPIIDIADTAVRIREGDLSARCEVEGADEAADLAASFNNMADTITSQMRIQGADTDIANVAVAAITIDDFAQALVAKLMGLTGSNIGAFYQRNRNGLAFEPVTSVGLNGDALTTFDADSREGEFGEALASRSICYTDNISTETAFTFKAVAGTAMPREIATIPLLVGKRVLAVLSLATLGEYTQEHRQILEHTWAVLNTALSNLMASDATSHMAEELQSVNEELKATNEELQAQAEEMQQQTEELEAQRKQVAEADRLKSEFLSSMSHELRTPLNSVLALSQLMVTRGLGKDLEQEMDYLRVIDRNGRQLLDLINDILNLSKIEAGRLEFFPADVEPGEVAVTAITTVNPLAEEKGLTVSLRAPQGLPVIRSDRDKVRQILLNLLSNAIKFTEAGSVQLTISQRVGGVAFSVTDTGQGITKTDVAQIFDEFHQVDGSTTRKHGGTGLGLSISLRLARLLGGDIAVTSEPGMGSTFTLTLPKQCPTRDFESAAVVERRQRPVGGRGATLEGSPHILVVEDNEVAAIQIRSVFEERGCNVTVAAGGAEGLKAVNESAPDAMVLDLMMPDIDGFAVLEQIRLLPETERLPVLVLTAKELTAKERARLKHNNVQELVQKGSLSRDELIERVAGLIAAQKGEERVEPATESPIIPTVPEGKSILIVEDNPDSLLTITAVLDQMGAGHAAVNDGKQAVQEAKASRPDLILMDIQLPVLSGLDATRRIKADPDLKHIPIIALTARAMAGDREEILAAGCDDYVSKPIDPVVLGKAIMKWLRQQSGETA